MSTAYAPALSPGISVDARPFAGTLSRRRPSGSTTATACRLPSPETTVSATARNAGADTVAGLTPLAWTVNVAGTRALLDPPAGFLTLVPGELPPPDVDDGATPTPPEPEVLVFVVFVVLAPVLVCVFVVVGVLVVLVVVGVFAVLDVLDVFDVAGGLAAPVVLLAGFEPPQPPIASAAINTPES